MSSRRKTPRAAEILLIGDEIVVRLAYLLPDFDLCVAKKCHMYSLYNIYPF